MTDSRDEHEPYGISPPVKDADIIPWLRCEADAAASQPSPWRMLAAAADAIERLTAERDEARQMYCRGFTDFCPNPAHDELSLEEAAMEVAKSFEWDCFKEDGNQ